MLLLTLFSNDNLSALPEKRAQYLKNQLVEYAKNQLIEDIPVSHYETSNILIKVDSTSSFGLLSGFLNIFGIRSMEKIDIIKDSFKNHGIKSFNPIFSVNESEQWYALELDSNTKNKTKYIELIKKLQDDKNILIAEPEYIYKEQSYELPGIDTDPGFSSQWYHTELGITDTWSFLAQRGVHPGGSPDVVVAVIDTGIDYLHNDLASNMWINPSEIKNGSDTDGNGFSDDIHGVNLIDNNGNPMDTDGHGTHVAGIIASAANNGIGGVGVAYNVKLMAVKAADSQGNFSVLNIARALNYAVDNGADVINMSFGGEGYSQFLAEILIEAYESSILVAAAGNSGDPNEDISDLSGVQIFPAYLPWVIGVMASQRNPEINGDFLADFSNWDSNPGNIFEYEVMAPGVQIYSTIPGNKYINKSGTSMATPIVSGIAALLRSYFADRTLYSTDFIFDRITQTGDIKQGITIQNIAPFSYKRVNSFSAITNNLQKISGAVSITGSVKYGAIVVANVSGIIPADAIVSLNYQWRRNLLPINGAVFSEYVLAQSDIGAQITVEVSGTGDFTGKITSLPVVPLKSDGPPPPPAPVLISKTYNSVTLNAVSGIEYRRGNGTWQTSGFFGGLSPETAYSFYARFAQTATSLASSSSEALQVRTDISQIFSTKYDINQNTGIISKIDEITKVDEFIKNLTSSLDIKVFDKEMEVFGDRIVGTGMMVKLFSGDSTFTEYVIVVKGDVTGNGKIEPTDYIRIRSHLLGTALLQGLFVTAADIDGNGKLEPTDYIRMRAHLLGREVIIP